MIEYSHMLAELLFAVAASSLICATLTELRRR